MLEHLTRYFRLVTNFRTSNIMQKAIILKDALPALQAETPSVRLKLAITTFIQENENGVLSTRESRRGA